MARHDAGGSGTSVGGAPGAASGLSERTAQLLLVHTPLGWLVRAMARMRSSVHFKLLAAFLLVALVVALVGAISLEIMSRMSAQSEAMHHAHQRVTSAQDAQDRKSTRLNSSHLGISY